MPLFTEPSTVQYIVSSYSKQHKQCLFISRFQTLSLSYYTLYILFITGHLFDLKNVRAIRQVAKNSLHDHSPCILDWLWYLYHLVLTYDSMCHFTQRDQLQYQPRRLHRKRHQLRVLSPPPPFTFS